MPPVVDFVVGREHVERASWGELVKEGLRMKTLENFGTRDDSQYVLTSKDALKLGQRHIFGDS